MKQIALFTVLLVASCVRSFSQCPNPAATTDGFHPSPDSLPCAERGLPYSAFIQVNVTDSVATPFGMAVITEFTIATVSGLPTGISHSCDPVNCVFPGGTSGCINLTGTTTDPDGLYPFDFIATLTINMPLLGLQIIGPASLDSLASQASGSGMSLPFLSNVDYYLNVIEQASPCELPLLVTIEGDTEICPGDQTTLEAVVANASGNETYQWSTGDNNSQIVVTTTDMYSVTVIDNSDTATASINVIAGQAPVAGFTVSASGLSVTFNNISTGVIHDYLWDFDDGNSSTAVHTTHIYASAGTYTVTLSVSNGCGTDVFPRQITVAPAPCITNSPTGNAGIFPAPDSVPCFERDVPYDVTMQLESPDTIGMVAFYQMLLDTIWIDSITNLPCGIGWEADKLKYVAGETGCIRVSGTTREITGQYPLKVYVTVQTNTVGFGVQVFSGELNDLIRQLDDLQSIFGFPPTGYEYKYVSRVIENGSSDCPDRDTSSALTSSGNICPPLGVEVSGGGIICEGLADSISAIPEYYAGAMSSVIYQWSPGGETTQGIAVSSGNTYSVTVDDGETTAAASVTVTEDPLPTASFDAIDSNNVVVINNTSVDAVSYFWDFGDGSTSTDQHPALHTYGSNGIYYVMLIAFNGCGSDTTTQVVMIFSVGGIRNLNDFFFEIAPNPSGGILNVQFQGDASSRYLLKVLDVAGREVFAERLVIEGNRTRKQFDLSNLAKGIYVLQVSSEEANGVKKIVLR